MTQQPETFLTRDECLALLRTTSMGRVALSIEALPVVLPVGFAMLGEDVVFRPLLETKLSTPGRDVVLAFQADSFDGSTEGWSVLVQGLASEVVGAKEIMQCEALRLPGIGVSADSTRFARLPTTLLTGRSFARCARSA